MKGENMSQFLKILSKRNRFLVGVVITLLVGAGVILTSCDLELHKSSEPPEAQWNITCQDDLVKKLETTDKEFKISEVGKFVSYGYQRMIDEAIVAGDRIVYVFDKNTGKLFDKDFHWRDDLPEHLPPIISREEAESMVDGKNKRSTLDYIPPGGTAALPIKPTPKNPCWVVNVLDDKGYVKDVIVIDAVEGEIVGHGIPPP